MRNNSKYLALALSAALLLFCFLVTFNRAMVSGYNKDEGQFVASGVLLASHGMLPYRDYAYFHMPNLVFIYGLLFRLVDFNLLAARLFSVICNLASLAVLLFLAHKWLKPYAALQCLLAGAALISILLVNPLFIDTSGQAWNHDLPILLTLLAVVFACRLVLSKADTLPFLVSGALLSLASGTRLVFILFLPAFLYALWKNEPEGAVRIRLRRWRYFLSGFALALLPSVWMFALAPQGFIFGNLIYPRFNTMYREVSLFQGPMDLMGKLALLYDIFVRHTASGAVLILWLLFFLIPAAVNALRQRKIGHQELFLFSLVVLALAGAMLPTPSWTHYYYAPIPFILLSILFGIGQLANSQPRRRALFLWALVAAAVIVNVLHYQQYPHFGDLRRVGSWYPIQTRVLGNKMREIAGDRPVLTFSPIYPLDGGAEIYPQFATGPFSWRIGEFLPPDERRALGLVSQDELTTLLDQNPPGGILIGLTVDMEDTFREFIERNGYRPLVLNNRLTFWHP